MQYAPTVAVAGMTKGEDKLRPYVSDSEEILLRCYIRSFAPNSFSRAVIIPCCTVSISSSVRVRVAER